MFPSFLAPALLLAVGTAHAQTWTATPFNPPSLPLAVKQPYVNVWAPQGNGAVQLNDAWPRQWDAGESVYGWYAAVRVDGSSYAILGDELFPSMKAANQTAVTFTPTRTSYLFTAGPVNVNATFLSPVEATNLVRQSIPFSYFYISVESNDGNSHEVQVYSDVSGEWISGDDSLNANWTMIQAANFIFLKMQLTSPGQFQEINDHPQDAVVYHCMENRANVKWQIGPADDVRGAFSNGTGLNNKSDTNFHAVGSPTFDVLGISVDLGSITSLNDPVVYAVGVVRDPVISYTNIDVQTELRSAYYWSQFKNIRGVIGAVLQNFDDSLSAAIRLDNQIASDAGSISGKYSDLLSLTTRQAMSAIEYTLLRDSNGGFNTSDIKAFMKDMGGVGTGGVNAVDVIYAAMPIYLYLNPNILGYLLSPLLEYQSSTQYQNPYAAQDLGSAFPNATGNYQSHNEQIEQSANMLIMSLAHAQTSGDGSLLAQHYNLLNGWANFLVNNSIAPGDETTSLSDGISATNQTNLALKGIIGIGAMAKISEYGGHSDDQNHYQGIATQYAQQWMSLASASDRLVLSYGSSSSGVIYNLFADKLLQLNLINSSVYSLQTSYYEGQIPNYKFGIPLDDGDTSLARSDWTMFAAASVTNSSVRDSLISFLHAYASPNLENRPFAALYSPGNGSQLGGINSPAQGAMFAPLALNVPLKQVTFSSGSSAGGLAVGAIVGASVGGVAFVVIVVGALVYYLRRRERKPQGIYNRADRIERVKPISYASESVLEPLSNTLHIDMLDLRHNGSSGVGGGNYVAGSVDSFRASTDILNRNASLGVNEVAMVVTPFRVENGAEGEVDGDYGAQAPHGLPRVTSPGGSAGISRGAGPSRAGITSPGSPPPPRGAWGAADMYGPHMSPPPGSGTHPKEVEKQVELRTEVDELRREIERMKEERLLTDEPPPSYDLEHAHFTAE